MNSFSSPERIIFTIENTHSVTFTIEDNRKALRKRLLKSNKLDYVGPLIETKQQESKINRLLLSVSQTINLENEAGSTCVEYPTKEFHSFHHCDEDFVYQENRFTNFVWILLDFVWSLTNFAHSSTIPVLF